MGIKEKEGREEGRVVCQREESKSPLQQKGSHLCLYRGRFGPTKINFSTALGFYVFFALLLFFALKFYGVNGTEGLGLVHQDGVSERIFDRASAVYRYSRLCVFFFFFFFAFVIHVVDAGPVSDSVGVFETKAGLVHDYEISLRRTFGISRFFKQ